ncbi:DnaJ domain-containing protein [Pararhizobium mangrovi]|uniref:J domain-containing protein n=1 Tax=Pararhizobium mangrovi TaxID=2590452 RepID=A0A506U5I4_9HYPH|nr:DnaJ domain-containing protein [Pararhizobium mangrovi]TPW28718.1 J domain-containing protein [Pararhizobium mangrovi]
MRDPYAVLGLPGSADRYAIKAAYRALAKRWHPDRHAGAERAHRRFQEIGEAYQALLKYRSDDERMPGAREAATRAGVPAGRDTGQTDEPDSAERMMERIFGVGPDTRTKLAETPELAPEIVPELPDHDDRQTAQRPDRQGSVTVSRALATLFRRRERTSGAAGHAPAAETGRGFDLAVPVTLALTGGPVTARLPNGATRRLDLPGDLREGQRIPVSTAGSAGPYDAVVRLCAHDGFWSSGTTLHTVLAIDLATALLGATHRIDLPDGALAIVVPAWSGSDRTLRLSGRGLRDAQGARGDLVVHLRVVVDARRDAAIADFVRVQRGRDA